MGDDKFSANPLESFMPHPSYTSDTLRIFKANQILERKRTSIKKSYYIIMGSDALNTIRKWKDYEYIFEKFSNFGIPTSRHCSNLSQIWNFKNSYPGF